MGKHINKRAGHYRKGTRLYIIWKNMNARCRNENGKNYKYYGGKGVIVCSDWINNYMNFEKWAIFNGYKENLTIDRIDVNGNYEPNNCRWATRVEQANNLTSNRFITHNGQSKTTSQWSYSLGGCSHLVLKRLKSGWSEEDAVTKPVGINKYNLSGKVINGLSKYLK